MMIDLKLRYFASLAEQLNVQSEDIQLPSTAQLSELKQLLADRGPSWHGLLEQNTLCAVNHEMIRNDILLQHGDEIAFFPPVTGG